MPKTGHLMQGRRRWRVAEAGAMCHFPMLIQHSTGVPIVERPAYGLSNLLAVLVVSSGAEWQMPRHFLRLPAVVVLAFFSTAAYAAAAEKSRYDCRNGSLVRRIIIEVGDINTGLPCEVVYWKDTEAPGVRRVLWNARSDVGYCETKASGLVNKLSGSGWRCEQGGEAVTTQQAAVSQ